MLLIFIQFYIYLNPNRNFCPPFDRHVVPIFMSRRYVPITDLWNIIAHLLCPEGGVGDHVLGDLRRRRDRGRARQLRRPRVEHQGPDGVHHEEDVRVAQGGAALLD